MGYIHLSGEADNSNRRAAAAVANGAAWRISRWLGEKGTRVKAMSGGEERAATALVQVATEEMKECVKGPSQNA